jgi:hypothetical protein
MLLKTFRTLLTAAAAALLMIGCGSEESTSDRQEPASRPSPATPPIPLPTNKIIEKIDPDGKAIHLTATNPAGKKFQASIGDEVEIPDEFPDDVPIFPGSTPMASMSAGDEGIIVTFKSRENQQVIFDFYQSSLVEGGWVLLEKSMIPSPLSLDAVKDNRQVSVVVTGTKGDARYSVIVVPKI